MRSPARAVENEVNVRYVLDKHPSLRLVAQMPRVGGQGVVGPCEPAVVQQHNGMLLAAYALPVRAFADGAPC